MAEPIENIIAPRAKPEPFLIALNQKILEITCTAIAPSQNYQLPFSTHSFARMSVITSKIINRARGNIQIIYF